MLIETKQILCPSCQVIFWVSQDYHSLLMRTHREFFCPKGHSQWYPGESDEKKIARLTRDKRDLQARIDMKDRQLEDCKKKPRKPREKTVKKK